MAEISTGEGKDGKKRSKKVSTKVDMTPMVDLAFLLITFFMLTTTLGKKHLMSAQIPLKSDVKDQKKAPATRTINVILGEEDKVYYYEDSKNPDVKVTDFSAKGIRQVFIEKEKTLDSSMIVLIRPMKTSHFSNLVDILDEIMITSKAPTYSIVEITKEDEKLIEESKGKL